MSVEDKLNESIGTTVAAPGVGEGYSGEWYEKLSDLFVSLVSIAVVAGDPRDPLFKAADIYDLLLFEAKEGIIGDASSIVSHPLVDILELTECLGPDAVYSLLVYAISSLLGGEEKEIDPSLLQVFADCMGWEYRLDTATPLHLASAIMMSLTGALNKALVKTVE
ncbi:MAG: hypothetical protein GSR73_02355 [Desulfurococcales archaeon]|nr:hypothetical protein [Desulfurococcales archaeon]